MKATAEAPSETLWVMTEPKMLHAISGYSASLETAAGWYHSSVASPAMIVFPFLNNDKTLVYISSSQTRGRNPNKGNMDVSEGHGNVFINMYWGSTDWEKNKSRSKQFGRHWSGCTIPISLLEWGRSKRDTFHVYLNGMHLILWQSVFHSKLLVSCMLPSFSAHSERMKEIVNKDPFLLCWQIYSFQNLLLWSVYRAYNQFIKSRQHKKLLVCFRRGN